MTATVTGPYEGAWKADKPVYVVAVKQDGFVDHFKFEARDASASGRAEALGPAQTFADRIREETQ